MAYNENINLFVTTDRNNADVFNAPLEKIIQNIQDTREYLYQVQAELDQLELRIQSEYTPTEQLNDLLANGVKGDKGDTGESLEYNWDGTALGVKLESESDFTYRELKGEPGDVSTEQLEEALTDYPTLEYLEEVKTDLENEIANIPKVTKTSELNNDSGFITASDIPTTLPASDVYAWAKAATKPTYTASEVGALASNGTATNASKVANALTLQIAGSTKNTFNGSSAQTFNIPNASTSAAGVMTTAMVTKLNGIATGATKNVVDTAMSSTSTNAVQNKVIYAYIQEQIQNVVNGGISVVKSVQRGITTIENGDNVCDVTIKAVNMNKAMVSYCGFTGESGDGNSAHRYRAYVALLNSTTVRIRRGNSGGDYTFSWEVIEFN